MTFEEFFDALTKPTYVYRMARGVAHPWSNENRPLYRSGRTRMANAQRRIDDLVLQRAATIADERRCAVMSPPQRHEVQFRCDYQRGHGKVGRGPVTGPESEIRPQMWDHGAPKAGVWWMNEGATLDG